MRIVSRLLFAAVTLTGFTSFLAAQSTTLAAQTANNTAACQAAGTPSYCQAGFAGMTDSATGTFDPAPANVSVVDVHNLLYAGATTKMFAYFQAWFCMTAGSTSTGAGTLCNQHIQVGYNSNDAATVNGQLNDMIQRGFDGAIIDDYGTDQTVAPGQDATVQKIQANLAARCSGPQSCPLYFALMEDDGAFKFDKCPYNGNGTDQTSCIVTALEGDLDYMNANYFPSDAYLKVNAANQEISPTGQPVVLFFVCETCFTNPAPNWTSIWQQVRTYTNAYGSSAPYLYLVFENAGGFSHTQTNGAFAWVNWFGSISQDPYGLTYLDNFYDTAAASLKSDSSLITIGAGWKGFDETYSPFLSGTPRTESQQCGNTWLQTFQQPVNNGDFGPANQLPLAGVVTWNDYEEGTEIETGIDNCLALSGSVSGTVLSWNLSFSSSSGSENTVHHYVLYDSPDGQNLTVLATFLPGTHSVDLRTFTLAPGSHTFYVQAVGQPSIFNHISNAIAYTVTVPTITTTSLPNGTINAPYTASLAATGGTGSYTWSIISGSLPAGLQLNASTGAISGAPTVVGTNNFTVQVNDQNAQSGTRALSITINPGPIVFVQSSATSGTSVAAVSATFPSANTSGNLIIAAVRMSTTTQTVALSDSLGNTYSAAVSQAQSSDGHQLFIFYAKNIRPGANTVTATFSGSNNHPWLAIFEYSGLSPTAPLDHTAHSQGSSAAPNSGAVATTKADELLFAAAGLPSSFTSTVTSGSGYSLLQQNTTTSRAASEGQSVTVTGTYAGSFSLSASANWSAALATFTAPTAPPAPSITTASLPAGTQNAAYSATLTATGGTAPYSWTLINDTTLPAGRLQLNSSTGSITGTPTGTGATNFTVQVTDKNSETASKALSTTVNPPPTIITTTLPSGTQNVSYSAPLTVSNGTPPYSWTLINGTSLPAGLQLNSSTGAITGTPTGNAGATNFTVQVTDTNGASATAGLSITINPAPLSITTTSLNNATVGVAYNASVQATGGATPYSWSLINGTSLPAGLQLNTSTGAITGTPTARGAINFTVQVTDSSLPTAQTAGKALSITVNAAAPVRVQAASIEGSAVSSVSVAFPAGNTAGNLIIAFVRASTTTQTITLSDTAGNTYSQAVSQTQTTDGHQIAIFYAANIKSGANTVTATFSATNNHPFLAIYEYHGVSTLDKTAGAQGTSAAASSGAAATATAANELIFAGLGLPSSATQTVTAGAGFTLEQQDTRSGGSRAASEDQTVAAVGAYVGSFTLSASTNWSCTVATFK